MEADGAVDQIEEEDAAGSKGCKRRRRIEHSRLLIVGYR